MYFCTFAVNPGSSTFSMCWKQRRSEKSHSVFLQVVTVSFPQVGEQRKYCQMWWPSLYALLQQMPPWLLGGCRIFSLHQTDGPSVTFGSVSVCLFPYILQKCSKKRWSTFPAAQVWTSHLPTQRAEIWLLVAVPLALAVFTGEATPYRSRKLFTGKLKEAAGGTMCHRGSRWLSTPSPGQL